jgi:hypothetical protein
MDEKKIYFKQKKEALEIYRNKNHILYIHKVIEPPSHKSYSALNIQLILRSIKNEKLCVAYAEWDAVAQSIKFIDFYYQNNSSKTGYFCEVFAYFSIAISKYVEFSAQFVKAGLFIDQDKPLSVSWDDISDKDPILKKSQRKMIFNAINSASKLHTLPMYLNALVINFSEK